MTIFPPLITYQEIRFVSAAALLALLVLAGLAMLLWIIEIAGSEE